MYDPRGRITKTLLITHVLEDLFIDAQTLLLSKILLMAVDTWAYFTWPSCHHAVVLQLLERPKFVESSRRSHVACNISCHVENPSNEREHSCGLMQCMTNSRQSHVSELCGTIYALSSYKEVLSWIN